MRRRLVVLASLLLLGASVFVACDDDSSGGGGSFEPDAGPGFDAKTPPTDAALVDATVEDASTSVDAADADVASPLAGIWQGTYVEQNAGGLQVLLAMVADPSERPVGSVVGLVAYPDLGCGSLLTRLDENAADAGVFDGGATDAGAGRSIVVHESPRSGNCLSEGDDRLTVLADGTMHYQYRTNLFPETDLSADGTLTHVGALGASEPLVGVWREPTMNAAEVHPLLAVVTRTDTVDAAAGIFLLQGDVGSNDTCAGVWTLGARNDAGDVTVNESFPQAQTGCTGVGSARLRAVAAQLQYERSADGGAEAGALLLDRLAQ
jgi:hypothetical protein